MGLPQEATLEVLQMIREALHNVQKHAGATRVAVAMEKSDRGLEISIDDNGQGFNFAGSYSLEELELLRLGPASLKRRARSLNADLLLESRPGRGAEPQSSGFRCNEISRAAVPPCSSWRAADAMPIYPSATGAAAIRISPLLSMRSRNR